MELVWFETLRLEVIGKQIQSQGAFLRQVQPCVHEIVGRAGQMVRERLRLGPEFNLLLWGTRELKLSFLSDPTFRVEAHPALQEAVSIEPASG